MGIAHAPVVSLSVSGLVCNVLHNGGYPHSIKSHSLYVVELVGDSLGVRCYFCKIIVP